jgi:mono/diheme cytochrome c family protein
MRLRYLVLGFLLPIAAMAQTGGDAYRGSATLERENCLKCHSIRGQGGKSAPDLGTRTSRQYTPAVMASVMWNHAPAMWSAMDAAKIARPNIGERDAEDLFAYFYSIRYFERPGEAERGKRVFETKHCAECHLSNGSGGAAKPVTEWTSLNDPVVLVERMWNHSSLMKRAFASKKLEWVRLSGQDLVDLTVYVQNLPAMRNKATTFWLSGPEGGEALFKDKGCDGCHQGNMSLEHRLGNRSLADVAAELWNHAPLMVNTPMVSPDEMRTLLSYAWEEQFLGSAGSVGRGKKVFEGKRCATCHSGQGGAPYIGRGEKVMSPVTMVSVVWKHGPAMFARMQEQKIAWPRLTPEDVSDVVAFLNTKP